MDTLHACLHADIEDPAIIVTGQTTKTISHAALAKNVYKLQRVLSAKGIERGTKVSMVLGDDYAFAVAFLALTLQSATVAPLNKGLKSGELEEYYGDFGAKWVVVSPQEVEKEGAAYAAAKKAGLEVATCSVVENDVEIQFEGIDSKVEDAEGETNKPKPDDIALVLGTSGTTGKPKSVPLRHGNIARSMSNIIDHYSLTSKDRAPLIMPLFHIHGLVAGLFAPLASGGTVIMTAKGGLTPSFFRDAVTHKATWYTGTPTLHKLASQMPMKEAPKLRFVRSCSSRLEGGLMRELEKRYGCPIVEAYAMTEAAHQVCSNPVDSSGTREGSVGLPTGVDVKIVDEEGNEVKQGEVGEVAIKGENVMSGYLNNDEANSKSFISSGHFRTGDQGKVSDDGYVSLTGRIKELINKGGEKISPVEVDNVINQHPALEEAVTFAMPDDMYGEDVGVAVILKSGEEVKESELKAWVGERLLQAKVPKKVFFVDKIPKTATNKLQRGMVAKTMLEEK